MRVVFMGTPDIAATCLKKIIADGYDLGDGVCCPARGNGLCGAVYVHVRAEYDWRDCVNSVYLVFAMVEKERR